MLHLGKQDKAALLEPAEHSNEVQFLVSAGEASGDLYAAGVVRCLSAIFPSAQFYGCAGPKLQAAGVQPVVDAARLSVVGLAEVVAHLPRIYREYRKLIRFAREHRPDAALLTDSPDFHLRVAPHLKRLGVPVFYLVAPQVWAWRPRRLAIIRKNVDKLFCLFPFEETWFRERGVDATYIGHPLAGLVRLASPRDEFLAHHHLPGDALLVTLLPGSRPGEARRHLPILLDAVGILRRRFAISAVLATPPAFPIHEAFSKFRERIDALSIKVVENETWDCIGHADVALAASGTVTIEAAMLGTPTVTFYKVNPLTWYVGRHLVKVPFFSMVNLIAERAIVPEFVQRDMTAPKIAAAADELLGSAARARHMRSELAVVRQLLTSDGDPFRRAADLIAAACHDQSVLECAIGLRRQ